MDTSSLKIGKKLALTLRKKIGEVEIIIFGSRARDDYYKFSDIDVCLIYYFRILTSALKELG